MTTPPPALDPECFRRLGHALVDLVTDYLAGLPARPVFRPMRPAERATLLQEALGEAGASPEAIVERFSTAVLPHAMGNGHPRFFGWVNSAPAPIGVLAASSPPRWTRAARGATTRRSTSSAPRFAGSWS